MNMETEDFSFIPPVEAPVFTPTLEQFRDPLRYIQEVRSVAEEWGICKIRPPVDWLPPFTLNVDKFVFTPRIQRLNELEANTRIKLNFLEQIAKFWELQGLTLTIPTVEKKILDIHALHTIVNLQGGPDVISREGKWGFIARKLGYTNIKSTSSILRSHYDRMLRPYDCFRAEETSPRSTKTVQKKTQRETRKLMRYTKYFVDHSNESAAVRMDEDPLSHCLCQNCGRGDVEDQVLLCDGCDDSYHTFCLIPPLNEIPPGDWRCPKCLSAEVNKPIEAYGFEQANRSYTLIQFGEMAENFKTEYFNMPGPLVPLSTVEKEFWRIVSSVEEDVTVEYGADLHAMDHGSAFPCSKCSSTHPTDREYSESKWNLNNIPISKGSVLRYIKADVSGMKIPWMYVGMCFSSFCWHNEDHWNYSINYLHWGEPKTWYGVSGKKAELFENCMKKSAPELFDIQPDLLHHLVTMMNPNILMAAGVPVCRTDQQPGEFVVTFPRAYHAGFNQGYNFAEAVNFAPADWLPIGRECVRHYSVLQRYCVFSHDELVCNIALDAHTLPPDIAAATYNDMSAMVEEEIRCRDAVEDAGICKSKLELFELLQDDERQCDICKTTCFLSAVTCNCNENKLVCLRHFEGLCKCPKERFVMRYRYSVDTLKSMLNGVLKRHQCFKSWESDVKTAMSQTGSGKKVQSVFQAYLEAGQIHDFSETDTWERLKDVVTLGNECNDIAEKLRSAKFFIDYQNDLTKIAISVEELESFHNKIEKLPFIIKWGHLVKNLLNRVARFKTTSEDLLKHEEPDINDLESCIQEGESIEIYLPELSQLRKCHKMISWLYEVQYKQEHPEQLTVDVLKKLLDIGVELPAHPNVEKSLSDLQNLSAQVEIWENKVKRTLQEKPFMSLIYIENTLKESECIRVNLPSLNKLKEILRKSREWIAQVEEMKLCNEKPYVSTLERLVERGRNIPARLNQLPRLELYLSDSKTWICKASRIFLRKNSHFSLMNALSPRVKFGLESLKKYRNLRRHTSSSSAQEVPAVGHIRLERDLKTLDMIAAFKQAEKDEIVNMNILRLRNIQKRSNHAKDTKYCVCRRVISGFMLECQLCKDIFHKSCVPARKCINHKGNREHKYICPCCLRSRKPRLETILSLLVDLHRIPVKIPEGEALQCLSDRAMEWQIRARQILDTSEVASALAKLSLLSQKKSEAEAKEKTERIISSEVKKVRSVSNPSPRVETIITLGGVTGDDSVRPTAEVVYQFREATDQSSLLNFDTYVVDTQEDVNRPTTDHTYQLENTTSKISDQLQDIEFPVISLSDKIKVELEELMMQGDLMDISLDESHHIWRILQATKLPGESPVNCNNLENEEVELDTAPVRKRISDKSGRHLKTYGQTSSNEESVKQTARKKVKMTQKQTRNQTVETDNDIDIELCSANNCLRPKDFSVDWVQCDGQCKKWYHLLCIGLEKQDIKTTVDYYCSNCSKNS